MCGGVRAVVAPPQMHEPQPVPDGRSADLTDVLGPLPQVAGSRGLTLTQRDLDSVHHPRDVVLFAEYRVDARDIWGDNLALDRGRHVSRPDRLFAVMRCEKSSRSRWRSGSV